ncbi:hypothetical protein BD289DRAFT_85300 [Coniella lustricola]|uniref:Uncharacterized protein n=1 Tax=Coniella lustricola TaxID=2025994 RepID=A0A2T2ZYZ2_9PEZI|nr:hypothetical protein BD289DRAFT_85300 [Coniella lustricola]
MDLHIARLTNRSTQPDTSIALADRLLFQSCRCGASQPPCNVRVTGLVCTSERTSLLDNGHASWILVCAQGLCTACRRRRHVHEEHAPLVVTCAGSTTRSLQARQDKTLGSCCRPLFSRRCCLLCYARLRGPNGVSRKSRLLIPNTTSLSTREKRTSCIKERRASQKACTPTSLTCLSIHRPAAPWSVIEKDNHDSCSRLVPSSTHRKQKCVSAANLPSAEEAFAVQDIHDRCI